VNFIASALKNVWHRAVLALVLVSFLVPMPGKTPVDEVRAAFVAAGMLCAVDDEGQAHHDAHCVLCLLPATGGAPDITVCSEPEQTLSIAVIAKGVEFIGSPLGFIHHARAPPPSIV